LLGKTRVEIDRVKRIPLDELEHIRHKKMREIMAKSNSPTNVSGTATNVSDGMFDDFVKQNPLVLVDCWAEWCGPCRMIAPVIEQLAKEFAGRVAFGKLNVDQNPATTARFRIMSIPTMLILKDGALVDTVVGAVPRDYIASRLKPFL